MSGGDTWLLRRSRLPALAASLLVAASGIAGLASSAGGWLWYSIACVCLGACGLGRALLASAETLRLELGDPVRLESARGDLVAEGRLDGDSVVSPWLIALRIRGKGAQRPADLILDPWSTPAEELRRLRVRLLGDETLRA